MRKKKIFIGTWNWLWLAVLFYAITFFSWHMSFSVGPFGMMARHGQNAEPFSLLELIAWTWEFFQFSWQDVLWIIVPSGLGYIIFAWRHSRLSFILPSLWLGLSAYYYFICTFSVDISYLGFLRESPEYWQHLPWWFHVLAHLSLFGYPVHP